MKNKKMSFTILLLMISVVACSPQTLLMQTPIAPQPSPILMPPSVAASTHPPQGSPIIVTDALNRQVSFAKPPQRIAIVGKALFMIADAAYTFPEAASRIAVLGDTAQGTNNFIPLIDPAYKEKSILTSDVGAEQIAAVTPDAVIMKSYLAETLGKPLEILGIPVVYLNLELIDQYPQDLKTLGQLFKNEDRAAQITAFFQERFDRIQNSLKGLEEAKKPRVLLLYYSEKERAVAFNVPPLTWMQTEMVTRAGGIPIWKDANLGNGWTKVNLEQIIAWDPDQIFIISYFKDANEVLSEIKSDPQWQAMRAVKEGHITPFASDVYSWDQPDTRWILGLTWLAGKLHPDLFQNLDMKTEVVTFYKDIYGMDDAAIQKDILPKVRY
jgi:iron complex transport system substrate-binding protein